MKLSEFGGKNEKEAKPQQGQADDLMGQYEKLKDLPKDQLSQMLLEEVARQKREGVFDYQKLNEMLESMKAFIPPDSYENIKRILESFR